MAKGTLLSWYKGSGKERIGWSIQGEGIRVRVEGMGGQQLKSEGCVCWKGATANEGVTLELQKARKSPGLSNRSIALLMTHHGTHVRILISRTLRE